jgi:Pyruvate/2-oxoacid:ferredoxin oxidoreductase delta subunit
VWLVFLRLFAKTFTYVMIIGIGVLMLAFTLYCFILAGALTDILAALMGNSTSLVPEIGSGDFGSGSGEVGCGGGCEESAAAKALGLVNSARTAIASLAPTELNDLIDSAGQQNPTLWWILACIMSVLSLIYIVSMLAARKKIQVSIAIVKEGSKVIKARPLTMFWPLGPLVVQLGLIVYFFLFILFLGTADINASHFEGLSAAITTTSTYLESMAFYNATIATGGFDGIEASQATITVVIVVYFLLGVLWTVQSVKNIGWTSMSGSVSHWFFFRDDPSDKTRFPLMRALGQVFRYHLGSIFFGSFIIAIIQLIRIMLMAVERMTKDWQDKNPVLKLGFKCFQCCLWCLEKTIKFITNYCFIYVAMQGSGFCKSCYLTFTLITKNMVQLAINTFVRTILSWIQLLGMPVVCAALCNWTLTGAGKTDSVYPSITVAIMAFIIASIFSTVFSCVLDTLFVCCARDRADYKGDHMPDELRQVFGFAKRGTSVKKSIAADISTTSSTAAGEEEEHLM